MGYGLVGWRGYKMDVNILYQLRQKKVVHNELLKIYNTIIQPYFD